MQKSIARLLLFKNEVFQERVLILAIKAAHEALNETASNINGLVKIQAKAAELINSPDGFKTRLAYSVVALLADDQVHEGIDDSDIHEILLDVLDGMAGVTPVVPL